MNSHHYPITFNSIYPNCPPFQFFSPLHSNSPAVLVPFRTHTVSLPLRSAVGSLCYRHNQLFFLQNSRQIPL